jgi:hypothetical protein
LRVLDRLASSETMTTTFLKRQKEFKRLEKQKAKAELRRNKKIARREQEHQGKAIADTHTRATNLTDPDGHDIENAT